MDIRFYAGFFHDGSLDNIIQVKNKIELWIGSREIESDDEIDKSIVLSKRHTIRGKLILSDVINITINNDLVDNIKKVFDSGEILDLIFEDKTVIILVNWLNFPVKKCEFKFEEIKIKAKQIYWESVPNLPE